MLMHVRAQNYLEEEASGNRTFQPYSLRGGRNATRTGFVLFFLYCIDNSHLYFID